MIINLTNFSFFIFYLFIFLKLKNGKSEGNNSRNIGTAMLGLIHYLIVVLGGVVYCGIGAATEFSNSGQVSESEFNYCIEH